MATKKIKFGVIGVGYLGKHHVKHLSLLNLVDVIGIYDINVQSMLNISNEYQVPTMQTLDELLEKAEAVSIVTPTNSHAEIALKALDYDCHVFIEKPISNTVQSATHILNKTQLKKKSTHVGHIERFNPAFKAFIKTNHNPLFIECHRLTTATNRSLDISVILDLMIHDIDLVLHIVDAPIKQIIADGISIISNNIDLANVKLLFQNNCVVNLTASRISNKQMRKMRVFEKNAYVSIDLLNKTVAEYTASHNLETKALAFNNHNLKIADYDALQKELYAFCESITKDDCSTKNIENSIKALDIANQINLIIENKRINQK